MEPWVAIEITRSMRMVNGAMADAGALSASGRNLFEHQVAIARELTEPDRILVLTAQSDATLLDLIGKHELREMPPFDFVSLMRERSAEGSPVVLLRQCVPLRDAEDVRKAVKLLDKHASVISASQPPAGHSRLKPLPGETEPDYRCLAFEVRRADQFTGALGTQDHLLFIDWDSFAEYLRPSDEAEVAAKMKKWPVKQVPGA
jgi:hypothetical protein